MKKLMVLTMVMGFAAAASAGLVWDVSPTGADTYAVSLNVSGDVGVNYISISTIEYATGSISDISSPLPEGLNNKNYVDMSVGGVRGTWSREYATQGVTDVPVYNGTVFSFTYTGTEPVLAVTDAGAGYNFVASEIGFTDSTKASLVGDITIVPEPMTMALLGLGGLFLRRRK